MKTASLLPIESTILICPVDWLRLSERLLLDVPSFGHYEQQCNKFGAIPYLAFGNTMNDSASGPSAPQCVRHDAGALRQLTSDMTSERKRLEAASVASPELPSPSPPIHSSRSYLSVPLRSCLKASRRPRVWSYVRTVLGVQALRAHPQTQEPDPCLRSSSLSR
jgi:hypothetical protein